MNSLRAAVIAVPVIFVSLIGFYYHLKITTNNTAQYSMHQRFMAKRLLSLVRHEAVHLERHIRTVSSLNDKQISSRLFKYYFEQYNRETGGLAAYTRYSISGLKTIEQHVWSQNYFSKQLVEHFKQGVYPVKNNGTGSPVQFHFVRLKDGHFSIVASCITGNFRDQIVLLFLDMKSLRQQLITALLGFNSRGIFLLNNSGRILLNTQYPEHTGKNIDTLFRRGSRRMLNVFKQTNRQYTIRRFTFEKNEQLLFTWIPYSLSDFDGWILLYSPLDSIPGDFIESDLLVYFLLLLILLSALVATLLSGKISSHKKTNRLLDSKLLNLQEDLLELRRTHARYNTLLNSMMVGIVMSNSEGRIIDCNQTFAEMLGYEMQELLGVNQKNLTPPKYWHEESGSIQKQLIRWGFTRDYEKEFIRKDGSLVPVLMNTTLVHDEEVQGTIMLSTLQDISAKKRADREIEKLHTHLEDIIESSPSAIITLDEQHKITSMNAAAERFFSVKRDELQRRQLQDAIPFFKKYEEEISRTIEDKRNITLSAESFSVGEDEVKYTNITLYPLHEEESGTIAIHLEDISEQMRLERQLYQSQKMEAMGTLASGFAHDFNNLLSGIYSYLSVLKMRLEDKESLQTVQTIHSIAQRASSLVKHILTFSRSSEVAAEPVNLKEICLEVEEIVSRSVDKNIRIENSILEEDCYILGDSSQISQVMMNLCINARDAITDGGTIDISLEKVTVTENDLHRLHMLKPGKMARISVSDTGKGISSQIVDRIFDPFFTTKSKGKGTGLGLSIVYGILRSHNGDIEVNSIPGKGTTFNIYLPLADPANLPATSKPTSEDNQQQKLEGKGTVLIIDDEEVICNAIREGFNRIGFNVLTANSGEDGIEIYKNQQVDLVLLDMIMPGMTGEETYRKLKEIDPAVKVVVQTGYTQPDSEQRMRQNGVLAVYHKPFDIIDVARDVSGYITG